MKTMKLRNLIMIAFLVSLGFTGCNKSTTSTGSGTSEQVATAQDAESTDAVMTNVEQDADAQADALEASNFNVSAAKGGTVNGVTITVDHPDTVYFPKVITFNYDYADTVNGEYMAQTGQIILTVDTVPVGHKLWWRKHLKRTFVFNSFSVTTDSSTFTVNGTRTMERMNWTSMISPDKLKLKVNVKDTIYSDLTVNISVGSSFSGSITRNVGRIRATSTNYYRLTTNSKLWLPAFLDDSVTLTGYVNGTNLLDSAYMRDITTPLVYTLCPVWPHNIVVSGVITDTEGTQVTTISYAPNGCKNKITATLPGGKMITISRRIDRKFHKWW